MIAALVVAFLALCTGVVIGYTIGAKVAEWTDLELTCQRRQINDLELRLRYHRETIARYEARYGYLAPDDGGPDAA